MPLMKRFKKIILALLIVPVAFVSCKKTDSNPAPASASGPPLSIQVNPTTKKANAGDQIPFLINVSGSNNLTTIIVTQSLGGSTATQVNKYDITSKSVNTYSYTENYTVPESVTGTITLAWTVTDSKNNTATTSDTITVSSPLSVIVTPASQNANPGDNIHFTVAISGTNTLKDISVNQELGGNITQITHNTLTGTSETITQDYTVPNTNGTVKISFIVTDVKGNSQTATSVITISAIQGTLGSSNKQDLGNQSSATGSAYSTTLGVTSLSTGRTHPEAIDMVYFSSTGSGAALASPSNNEAQSIYISIKDWSSRNTTSLVKVSNTFNFPGATLQSVANAYTAGAANAKDIAANLAVGDTYVFHTNGGKFGIFTVTGIAADKSIISIDIRVQQ